MQRDADCTKMQQEKKLGTMPGTSKSWSQRTSGRDRRDALYATLEAAVREDFSCSRNGGGFGNTEFGVAGRSEDASTGEKTYPYPILWYEEMTPSDLDAYHAACCSDQTTPCSLTGGPVAYLKDLKEECPLQHGNITNVPQNCGDLLRRNLCMFSTRGTITWPTTSAQAPIPTAFGSGSGMPPPVYSSSFSETPCPIRHEKGDVTTLDDSMDPFQKSRASEACSRKAVSTWTSQTRSPTPASARGVRAGPICSEPERGIVTLNWRESGAVAAAAGVRKKPRCQGAILQTTSSTVDSSATGNLSWQGLSSRCTSQLMGAEDGPDAKGKEVGGPFPSDCRFIRGKEPTPTPTLPSEPSQDTVLATQTMFMPGLPSQVLITLEGEDTTHVDYQKEEEDEEQSLGSEHDLSPPSPHMPTPSVSIKRLPDGKAPENHGTRSAVEGAGCADVGLGTGCRGTWNSVNKAEKSGHNYCRVGNRKERRAQVHGEFIRALEVLTIGTKATSPDVMDKEPGYRDRSRFVLVSTEEILPTAWAGRQAEAVDTLESHLLRARDRSPDGYVVRALELASHVLSRPRVCICLGDEEIDRPRRMPPPRVGVFGYHKAKVVGVAGFVWEILCTEKNGVRQESATADAQPVKKGLSE